MSVLSNSVQIALEDGCRDPNQWDQTALSLSKEIDTLELKIAELEKDKARLDCYSSHWRIIRPMIAPDMAGYTWTANGKRYRSLREAIDGVMELDHA